MSEAWPQAGQRNMKFVATRSSSERSGWYRCTMGRRRRENEEIYESVRMEKPAGGTRRAA